MTIFYNVDELW